MPFPYIYVCDLLDKLEQAHLRDAPYLPKDLSNIIQSETLRWFQRHKDKLNAFQTSDGTVMSMLRPQVWTDRDYGLDAESLDLLMARLLGLTRPQRVDLHKWKTKPWTGDIGTQVARVLENMNRTTTSAITAKVAVEDIEIILLSIASHNEGSSDLVNGLASACDKIEPLPLHGLKKIYDRLQPREAKWLTRLLLKSTGPVTVPADFGISSYQSKLPNCVKLHVDLPASSPPVLQVGLTGAIKPSIPKEDSLVPKETVGTIMRPVQKQACRRTSTSREGSPETDQGSSRNGRYKTRESGSMRRTVSRPKFPLTPVDAPLPPAQPTFPTTGATIPALVDPKPQLPLSKRRRISREESPGALTFARGILKPLPLVEVSYNRSYERAGSSLSQSKSHCSSKNLVTGKENPENRPPFRSGASCQTSQKRCHSNVNTNIPTPPKSSPAKETGEESPLRRRKIPAGNRSEARESLKTKAGVLRSERHVSNRSLLVPTIPNSDLTPRSSGSSSLSHQASALADKLNVSAILKTQKPPTTASNLLVRGPIPRQIPLLPDEFSTATFSKNELPGTTSDILIDVVVKSRDAASPLANNNISVMSSPKGHTVSNSTRAHKSTSVRSETAKVASLHPSLRPLTLQDSVSPLLKAGYRKLHPRYNNMSPDKRHFSDTPDPSPSCHNPPPNDPSTTSRRVLCSGRNPPRSPFLTPSLSCHPL